MAGLPDRKKKSSELTKFEEKALELFAKGHRPPDIAYAKYPDDRIKRQKLRRKLWRLIQRDARIQSALAERAKAELVLGVAPASERLAKRSRRLGKPQEVKLLFEASGFHNSRVQHEHTGDIKISLDMPRPERLSVDPEDEEVIDAEVVDED